MPKKRSVKRVSRQDLIAAPPTPQPAEVEQVLQWLLLGHREEEILASLRTAYPHFAADPSPLLLAAVESLKQSAEFDCDIVRGWCFEATKFVYQKMLDIGDHAGALRAVRQLTELAK